MATRLRFIAKTRADGWRFGRRAEVLVGFPRASCSRRSIIWPLSSATVSQATSAASSTNRTTSFKCASNGAKQSKSSPPNRSRSTGSKNCGARSRRRRASFVGFTANSSIAISRRPTQSHGRSRAPGDSPPDSGAPTTHALAPEGYSVDSNSASSTLPFDSNLTAVDLALSATVVQPMSTWQFDDLERRGERLLDRAHTADERDNARRLLDRIAKFEDIKRRSDAIAGIDSTPERHRFQLTGLTTGPTDPFATGGATSRVALAGGTSRYDAVGKLTAVRSQRPNAPPFALLNADHEPVAFVTPSPGVDLRPLLGRQIGVSGQRGYMPEFRKPHITAMQAEPIDGSDVIMALRDQMRR